MKLYKFLSAVSLSLLCSSLLGQDTGLPLTQIDVIPPSPTASEFTKYGTYPVDHSTGVPGIQVPLYTYQGITNGLALDVNLSYHAGGIKVKQHASNVGLGWSLIAGGVITRTTNGMMDETPTNGLWHYTAPNNNEDGNTPFESSLRPFNNIAAGNRDAQLDAFSFNFNGRSGSFYIGKNEDVLFVEDQKLHIQWEVSGIPIMSSTQQAISRFTITDEYGVRYVFDNYEITTTMGAVNPATKHAVSCWYLSEIISPINTDKIVFEYDNGGVNDYSTSSQFSRAYFVGESDGVREKLSGTSSNSVSSTIKRIKKITFPDLTVMDIVYSGTQREDMPGDYLVKDIVFSNGDDQKGYSLVHDYSLNKATLKEVVPYHLNGSNQVFDKGYSFDYFVNSANNIPTMLSGVDHWGYYLGNNPQGEALPYEVLTSIAPFPTQPPYFSGTNRQTDSVNVKVGSLEKITYPSGGHTIFEMEPHQADHPWLDKEISYTTESPPWTDRSASCYVSSDYPYRESYVDITYQGENNGDILFTVTVSQSASNPCMGSCSIGVELYSSTDPSTMVLMNGTTINYPSTGTSTGTFMGFNLVKGNRYRVVMYAQGFSSFGGSIPITWREENTPESTTHTVTDHQKFVGGLRVKSIKNYEQAGSTDPVSTWEYEYTKADGTSSGVLGYYPMYTYSMNMYYRYRFMGGYQSHPDYNVLLGANTRVIVRSNTSIYPPEYISGNLVTYNRVVEKSTSQGQHNGAVERRYSTRAAHVVTSMPQIPPQNASWGVGDLLEETVYDASGEVLKKTKNTFRSLQNNFYTDAVRRENFRSLSLAPARVLIGQNESDAFDQVFTPFEQPIFYISSEYFPYGGRSELMSSTETMYHGNDSTVMYQGFSYDPIHLYKRTDTLYSSDGQSREITNYRYPHDLSAAGNVFHKMVDLNMVFPIVEATRKKIREGASDVVTDIKKWNYVERNQRPVVGQIEELDRGNDDFYDIWKANLHDGFGNPREVQTGEGSLVVYLWGYGGQYPIAQIENASFTDVLTALGGGTTTAHHDAAITIINNLTLPTATDEMINTHVQTLRTELKKAQVTTYTYRPLVGMTSMTDPRGISEYYQYDGFQRLQDVLDFDGNILRNYQYHYKP